MSAKYVNVAQDPALPDLPPQLQSHWELTKEGELVFLDQDTPSVVILQYPWMHPTPDSAPPLWVYSLSPLLVPLRMWTGEGRRLEA